MMRNSWQPNRKSRNRWKPALATIYESRTSRSSGFKRHILTVVHKEDGTFRAVAPASIHTRGALKSRMNVLERQQKMLRDRKEKRKRESSKQNPEQKRGKTSTFKRTAADDNEKSSEEKTTRKKKKKIIPAKRVTFVPEHPLESMVKEIQGASNLYNLKVTMSELKDVVCGTVASQESVDLAFRLGVAEIALAFMMKRSSRGVVLQDGCILIRHLAIAASQYPRKFRYMARDLCILEAVKCIVHCCIVVQPQQSDDAFLESVVAALIALRADKAYHQRSFTPRAVQGLVQILKRRQHNQTLIAQTLELLGAMAWCNLSVGRRVLAAGGVEAILGILKHFESVKDADSAAIRTAINVLEVLVRATTDSPRKSGVPQALRVLLDNFPASSKLHASSVAALQVFANNSCHREREQSHVGIC